MTELEYRICKIIKIYNEEHKIDPCIKDIAKVIHYSNENTRYHLKKLKKLGIVKEENRKYSLLVNNME